jgi:hypothetical protein
VSGQDEQNAYTAPAVQDAEAMDSRINGNRKLSVAQGYAHHTYRVMSNRVIVGSMICSTMRLFVVAASSPNKLPPSG